MSEAELREQIDAFQVEARRILWASTGITPRSRRR